MQHSKVSEVALIYSSCVEMCADLRAGVMLLKDAGVIRDNFVCDNQ